MGSESVQNRLGRDRPPRVHIHYKVEKGDAIELIELPFVVGVMADLSGQRAKPLPEWSKREAQDLNAGSFDQLLEDAAPRVAFTVPNVLSDRKEDDTDLSVDISFDKFADFNPTAIAKKVDPLRKLLEFQESLKELKRRIMAKPELGKKLEGVLKNRELLDAVLQATDDTAKSEGTK